MVQGEKDQNSLATGINRTGVINYTKDNIVYKIMDNYDKMNYAVYMMDYDVEKYKEVGEGAAEVSLRQSFKGKHSIMQKIMTWLFGANPKSSLARIVNVFTYVSLLLIIFVFGMWIAFYILGVFITIQPVKKTVLLVTWIFLVGLVGLTYILEYVSNKTYENLEILHYYIK